MMNIKDLLSAMLIGLTVSSCASLTATNQQPNYMMYQAETLTYDFIDTHSEDDSDNFKDAKNQISNRMNSQGFIKHDTKPDLLVSLKVLNTELDYYTLPKYLRKDLKTEKLSIEESLLLITLIESESGDMIWNGIKVIQTQGEIELPKIHLKQNTLQVMDNFRMIAFQMH